MRDVVERRKG